MKSKKLINTIVIRDDTWPRYIIEEPNEFNKHLQVKMQKSDLEWVNFVFEQFEEVQDFLRKKYEKVILRK